MMDRLVGLKTAVLAGLISAIPVCVEAHPHNWIDLTSHFVLDKEGALHQLNQHWKFDSFYSLMTYADLMNEYGDAALGLNATAATMAQNLESYQYFSEFYVNGVSVKLKDPASSLQAIGKDADMQLILEMEFTFEPAVDIQNKPIALRVFDPTYFIAMNHTTEDNVRVISANNSECETSLDIPAPSQELIDYALSLDRLQTETSGLGTHFAETVQIHCSS